MGSIDFPAKFGSDLLPSSHPFLQRTPDRLSAGISGDLGLDAALQLGADHCLVPAPGAHRRVPSGARWMFCGRGV